MTNPTVVAPEFHVVGDAFVDLFCFLGGDSGTFPEVGGDSLLQEPVSNMAGGSSLNTATHLSSLERRFSASPSPSGTGGGSVKLHTILNPNDSNGRILLDHASKHKIDLMNCWDSCDEQTKEISTGHCVVIVSGEDRSFMTYQGLVSEMRAELLLELNPTGEQDTHIHVSGFFNMPGFWNGNLMSVLERIRTQWTSTTTTTRKLCISLVPQYDATTTWNGGLTEVIPLLDFVILNEIEATKIMENNPSLDHVDHHQSATAGQDDAVALSWAAFFGHISACTTIVVTLGPQGAMALRGGKVIASQATTVVTPVDPTGAGDSFAAGFLHGLWKARAGPSDSDKNNADQPWPTSVIESALRWGCALGTAAVKVRGASVPCAWCEIAQCMPD